MKNKPKRELWEEVYHIADFANTKEIRRATITGVYICDDEVYYSVSQSGDKHKEECLYDTPEEVRLILEKKEVDYHKHSMACIGDAYLYCLNKRSEVNG
jgi:hypothetical protein